MSFWNFVRKTTATNSSSPKSSESNKNSKQAIPKPGDNCNSTIDILNQKIGSREKPAKIEKQKLQDGSIYSGDARLLENGFYLPYGYGKKIISPQMEMTAHWIDGVADGVCYLNMHFAMVTGHFTKGRPNGWCLSMEGPKGFVFGVFKNDDCIYPLGESVLWMIRSMEVGLRTSYKHGQILVGEIIDNQSRGFHFMNNGDLYVGIDDSKFSKTGFFFKFTNEGYIEIGEFKNGNLIEELPAEEVIDANMGNYKLYKPLDTKRNYFK